MRLTTCLPPFDAKLGRRTLTGTLIGLLPLALMSGCAKPLVFDATLPQQLAELSCIEDCRAAKTSCDADARYDYRQCQAGYGKSFRDYRWCLASARDQQECGYPWWSCAENLYGYCSNHYNDCKRTCEAQGH